MSCVAYFVVVLTLLAVLVECHVGVGDVKKKKHASFLHPKLHRPYIGTHHTIYYNSTSDLDSGATMKCGSSVSVCGLLVIETGLGSGVYDHPYPTVHGLWPEVSPYGDSDCIAPDDDQDPTILYPCYDVELNNNANNNNHTIISVNQYYMPPMDFEIHEWQAHGVCAGVVDADDFFTQVCDLVSDPLDILGPNISSLNTAVLLLENAGYEVYAVDTTNAQVELSACLTDVGIWVTVPQSQFSQFCS